MANLREYYLLPLYMGKEIIGYVNTLMSAEELAWQYIRENHPKKVDGFYGIEFNVSQFDCVGNREFFNMEEL